MDNHYAALGLNSSATLDEIRRAYRILARRYHPDVNPGAASEEKFKKVAEAYRILIDIEKRRLYDLELERLESDRTTRGRAFAEYARASRSARMRESASQGRPAQKAGSNQRPGPSHHQEQKVRPNSTKVHKKRSSFRRALSQVSPSNIAFAAKRLRDAISNLGDQGESKRPYRARPVSQISIIEISITVADAIRGVRKTVEISEGTFVRKISVTVPPGVRNGSVVRFRDKSTGAEEVVILVRVAAHPSVTMTAKGLVIEIPVTVSEALYGAKIQAPGLDEPCFITVEPGSQSGTEIRVREKGALLRDGTKGDLFFRLMIRVPTTPQAVGLQDKVKELEAYYSEPIRRSIPKSVFDL